MAFQAAKKRKIDDENRKFKEEWSLKYFFIECNEKPTCLICRDSVAVLKDSNLKRHYETRHQSQVEGIQGPQRLEYLKTLRKKFDVEKNRVQHMFQQQLRGKDDVIRASFEIAFLIARDQRSLGTGEFVKKCIAAAINEICPDKLPAFNNISLSRRTITRRIEEIGKNLENQLERRIKDFSFFAIALDESTDVSDTAQLLIFVRGVSEDFQVTEELATLASMKDRTTGEDIYREVRLCLEKLQLQWKKLCNVTTDGAPCMQGLKNGVVGRVNEFMESEGLEIPVAIHCIIHIEALCSKTLEMKNIMDVVVKIVNFIRSRALNHRQFKEFLQEIEASHGDVIYHNSVRWLSRAKVLTRFLTLFEEIEIFLTEKSFDVPELSDPNWLWDLAFLTDISNHCNILNLKLQTPGKFIYETLNDVSAFQRKLNLFIHHIEQQNFAHFDSCTKMRQKLPLHPFPHQKFSDCLHLLQEEFVIRFNDANSHQPLFSLVENPFRADVVTVPEKYQLELIELQSNSYLRDEYEKHRRYMPEFYKLLDTNTFPELRQLAQRTFTMFASTYICEQTFSRLNGIKTAERNSLTDLHTHALLRTATTTFKPEISRLVDLVQSQPSH